MVENDSWPDYKVFKSYAACLNKNFVKYVVKKREWEDGKAMTNKCLIEKSLNKQNILNTKEIL